MPLPSSRRVQKSTTAFAAGQPERTGTAQHQNANATITMFNSKKPSDRLLVMRELTKRAGRKTSYRRVKYSSQECAVCAPTRSRKANRILGSTRLLSRAGRNASERRLTALFQIFRVPGQIALHPVLLITRP